ncbi:MAG: sugar ABC transporter substrate-binding protein [Bacillota bacterium]
MRLPASKIYILAVMLFLLVPLWGCPDKEEAKKPAPPVKIAVIFADMERDGNKVIKKVMDGKKKEEKIDIIWMDAKNDQARQVAQLERLGDQKVKAAVIQFVSPEAGPDLMRKLVEKNIKVVALETLPADMPVDAYVASNHRLSGQLLARFAVRSARKGAGLPVPPDALDQGGQQGQAGGGGQGGGNGGKTGGGVPPETQVGGKVPIGAVLLSGDPRDPQAREIAAAARESLQGSAEVRLLAEEAVPYNDISQVPRILQDLLVRNGNNIQAVLATDSKIAMAAVDVLKGAGINNRVLTAGVGATEEAYKALASGEHDAEVDTRPDLLGQYALDAAVSLAKGGSWEYDGQTPNGSYSVPTRITPVRLIQSDNVYLLEQQWGSLKGEKDKEKKGKEEGGSGEESGGGEEQKGSSHEGGGGEGKDKEGGGKNQGEKTMLRITTQDGKTMEVQIDGEIKKIESTGGGKKGREEQGQGRQQ